MNDVIVIGAVAAGLTAARVLRHAGRDVLVLEASNRVGGRVHTLHHDRVGVPLELGAEFIHGEAKETRRLLDEARLATVDVAGQHYRSRNGRFEAQDKVWKRMARVFKRMDANRDQDRSFEEFLATRPGGPLLKEERELARGFVQGFNAADTWRISEKSLAEQGDPTAGAAQAARVLNGYGALIEFLARDISDVIRVNNPVQRILWEDGHVSIATADGVEHEARAAVITVSVALLQDESIAIEPEVSALRQAARQLVMGHVARVNIVVRERFWEKKIPDVSFVHTPERPFNVWWTMQPVKANLMVGWAGGPPALALARDKNIAAAALRELARAFALRPARMRTLLEDVVTYDWSEDRWFGGAYSYTGVGGSGAAKRLSQAVRGTLFIAGEATDAESSGTVEGAIASGRRAARQVVNALV